MRPWTLAVTMTLLALAPAPSWGGEAEEWLGLGLVPGPTHVYRDGAGRERRAKVVRAEPAAGKRPACTVVEESGPDGRSETWYAAGADGVLVARILAAVGGRTVERPVGSPRLLLRWPSRKGDRWTYGKVGEAAAERVFQVEHLGSETVTVPAGRHDCLVLRLVWNAGPEPVPNVAPTRVVRTLWLARGVGLVRETVESLGGVAGVTRRSFDLLRIERP